MISFVILAVVTSCERQPEITPEYPPVINPQGGLFILNEGLFQTSRATFDYYDFGSQVMSENAFETKNGRKLGDILQSMTRHGSNGYLVVNNSQKIEVIDVNTLASKATITGFTSPRYMVVKNDQKAYVSEYYNGGVKVIDMTTNQVSGTIPLRGYCEEMLLVDNKLYVTVTNGYYLYIINTQSDVLMDSIAVAYGSNSLRRDKDGYLWVMSGGRKTGTGNENGALHKINTLVDTVMYRYPITRQSEYGPMKLRMNAEGNTLYWINKDIFRHKVSEATVSAAPWIPAVNNTFWALNCDSVTGEVYVGDALDYVQRSIVNRYDENAVLRGTFRSGQITTDFFFYYK